MGREATTLFPRFAMIRAMYEISNSDWWDVVAFDAFLPVRLSTAAPLLFSTRK